MVNISKMTDSDTSFAAALAQREGWGHRDFDYRRLLSFEPDGCFIAWDNDNPVGMITSISFGHYAFLASLIVDKPVRGRGIGQALMRRAIEYLQSRKIISIELDGVIDAVPLYRKLGFKDKYLSFRFIRKPVGNTNFESNRSQGAIGDIVEFDKKMIGLDRSRIVRQFCDEFKEGLFTVGDFNLEAYAVVRPREKEPYYIGPFVAINIESFEKLLGSVINAHNGISLKTGVPETNRNAVEALLSCGFEYIQPSLRMYLGEKIEYEKHVYGILSAEKG